MESWFEFVLLLLTVVLSCVYVVFMLLGFIALSYGSVPRYTQLLGKGYVAGQVLSLLYLSNAYCCNTSSIVRLYYRWTVKV